MAGCLSFGGQRFEANCKEGTLVTGEGTAGTEAHWPEYSADEGNTGTTTDDGPNDPVLAWRVATCDPMGETSPVVADGTVYVALTSRPGTRAFDVATGEQQWTAEFIGTSPGQAVADGTLYVAGHGLTAFDTSEGSREWTFERSATATPEGNDEPKGPGPIWGAPAVADGTVFVPGGLLVPWLYALDATDGSIQWRTRFPGTDLTSSPAVGDDAVYVVDDTNRLVAIDRARGDVQWAYHGFDSPGRKPTLAGGRLYVVDAGSVHAFDRAGEQIWTIETDHRNGSLAIDGKRAYLAGETAIIALDAETGTQLWEYDGGAHPVFGEPVIADGTVYVGRAGERGAGTEENEPAGRILAIDGATGDRRWAFTTRGIPAGEGGPYAGTRGSLAVGDGTLFACTQAGDLYAIADQ
jgi:outer membrane protein assembly factor BamB